MNRRSLQNPALLLGVALCLSAVHVSCAQLAGSTTQVLLDKAHTLEARGRMDMAAQTWQQVLLADPNNTEALGGLARFAKLAGNQSLADTYLQRLRSINPNDPGIARAERTSSQTTQNAQLQRAGRLAEQGDYTQALDIYRQVFGAQPPAGDWAMAYYETEAATQNGQAHAVTGLRALAQTYPHDSRYQVALGRILTYNPQTRAEGRRYLERYPENAEAREALKISRTWDQNTTGNPGRSGSAGRVQGPDTSPLGLAYAALNAKRFSDAEARFKSVLAKDPKNARALAGLGYVRMDQQNFAGAISYLEQAKAEGAKDSALDRNLETSRFFYILSEGATALNENDLTTAEQKYQEALHLRPENAEALQGLAGTLMKAGQPQSALPYLRRAASLAPTAASYRDLFTAQYQSGDAYAALMTERQIPAAVRTQLVRDPEYLRTLASAYNAVGRDADAQRVLHAALDLPFPAHGEGLKAETRLQYAGLLAEADRNEQAIGLYRQVLADDAKNVSAWQGLVDAQHAMQGDTAAMQTIESMPPQVYDQALRDPGFLSVVAAVYQANHKYDLAQSMLDRAIAARNTTGQAVPAALQVQLAGLYLQRNEAAQSLPIYRSVLHEHPDRVDAWEGLVNAMHVSGLDRDAAAQAQQIPPAVRTQLEASVNYLQTMAQVYTAVGQQRTASAYMARVNRSYASRHTAPPADTDIQNAWLLYNGGNDNALYRQLLALGSRPDLSDDQRRTVQTIWAQWAVRRANQASGANKPRRALAILNAAASSFPDNPVVIKALASGYLRAGMPKEAVAIFQAEDMTSASPSDYKTAIGAALAANDQKDAETWLRYGLEKYPREGGLLSLAAKFEQARGDAGKAEEYYRAALAALPPATPGSDLAAMLHQPLPLNPRGLPTDNQQGLASLLAPADPNTGQAGSQEEPSRPYLPSYLENSGPAAPDTSADVPTRGAVPPYMGHPAPAGDRLRDYVPAGPQRYGPPEGTYQPSPGQGAGMADNEAPSVYALPSAQQSAYQQEQIVLANRLALDSGSTAKTSDGTMSTPVSSSGAGAKGAIYNGEVYGPYVPYVAPTIDGNSVANYQASNIEFPTITVFTDFPVADEQPLVLHNATGKKGQGAVVHPQDAPADAAEVRRRQSEPYSNTGVSRPDEMDDLTGGQNVQYNPLTTPPPGQKPRPGSQTAQENQPAQGSTAAADSSGQFGQQYPRPVRRPSLSASTTRRRRVRTATAVGGFGPGSAPLFYPSLPTDLNSQPYPDLPAAPGNAQDPPSDDDLIARNVPPLGGRGVYPDRAGATAAGPPLTERQQAELDLATLEASYSGWVGGSAYTRVRSGEPGIDRLQDYEIPFEASIVAGKSVRFSVIPKAVFLTSGTIDSSRYGGNFVPYLGTLPANAANTPSPQYASGVGGEIQMVTQNFGLAAGYTPYEFLVHNITGRLRYRPAAGPFTIFGERDSVRQTQLSYAGLRDPGSISLTNTGNIWGGVVSSGGGVRFDHGNERAGFYIGGAGAVLTGYHTLDNSSFEGNGGAYFRIHQFPGYGSLNIGANLFAEHYAHNERALTYGNGGYFSPDIYFLGSIPLTFTGNYKSDWHYVVQASLGVQTFQESSAPFYPLPEDAARQNLAYSGCTIPQIAARNCLTAELPVNSNTGANFSINAETSYRLTDHWYAGAALSANNTNNYNLVQPTVFLRYLFRQQYSTDDYPTGLFPTDGFRPLRVP